MKLRSYQREILDQTKISLKQGAKAPLLVLPTGAGKTVIFSELAKDFVEKGKKVLILVHRRELVKQACQKLDDINVEYGIIASGFESDHEKYLQVASVYTLFSRINSNKDVFKPDVIIFDEAHHVAAGTWTTVIDKYKKALRVGVTATPIRLDNRPLGNFFDKLISGVQIQELVQKKYLSQHKVFAGAELPDLSDLKERRGDYQAKDLKKVMDKPVIIGDAVHQYKKHLLNKPAIAFCVDISHATKVLEQFKNQGVKAEILTGSMSNIERDKVLENLKNKKTHVIVSVDVISEGTDLPCVTGAILLRPTKSQALYMQQVGRILRPEKDKTAIVLDHVGNTYRHDFIDVERNWQLDFDHEYVNKKPKPVLITCKNCGCVYKPQKCCPDCGYKLTRKELMAVEGDLKELKREEEKNPITIKDQYPFSLYAKNKFHDKNIEFFKYIKRKYTGNRPTNKVNISFKQEFSFANSSNEIKVGDNVVFYEGMNKQKYGVVIAFIDLGYENKIEEYRVVPEIPGTLLRAGFDYMFPEIVKAGVDLEELKANDLYLRGKRGQPYVYLESPLKFVKKENQERLYLETKTRNLGMQHRGHNYLLLTDQGLTLYEATDKKTNFKHGEKIRRKIRSLPSDRFLLDNLIDIARQNAFKTGYNSEWIYINFYARHLINILKKTMRNN